jgi:hypothetical protein
MARNNKKEITEEITTLEEATPSDETKAKGTEPVNIELENQTDDPVAAAEPQSKEKIETDVRKKLGKKTDNEDVFVPANPAALEKEAKLVAQEQGFDLNRGTSIGARLMARRRLG